MIKEINFNILLLIFFAITFIGTILQSIYTYDPFHTGLIAQSALDLNSQKLPYKDFFIHYGFFVTLVQSLIMKISNNDIIYLMYFSALTYAVGNLLLCQLIKKFTDLNYASLASILLFSSQPFANFPWANYLVYFLLISATILIFKKKRVEIFFSGLLFSLMCLSYENLYLIFIIILFYIFLKKSCFFAFISGFLLPLLIFHTYLFINNLHLYWYKTFSLNNVFLDIYQITTTELIINYFKIFLSKIIFNMFTEPQFLLYFLILIFNLIFIFIFIKNYKKNKNLSENILSLLLISLLSLFFYATTLHKLNSFRFSTGPVIGIIIFFYIIKKTNFVSFKKYFLTFITLLIFSTSITPIKKENNRFFPYFNEINDNVKNKNIDHFKSQIWPEEIWKNLNFIDNYTKEINKKCLEVKYFFNYTNDGFIYMIANKNLESFQYLHWYKDSRYHETLMKHYNPNYRITLLDNLKKNNTILFIDSYTSTEVSKILKIEKYIIIKLPYNYYQKNISILIPDNCKI